ncbi:primosomal protein [Microbacterium sp. NPDC019599]|uniref:primosomal protein n=1 Tax=Microbacterium sp. NPDC019599 TaxID=3154690 RepID=UPI0033E488DD
MTDSHSAGDEREPRPRTNDRADRASRPSGSTGGQKRPYGKSSGDKKPYPKPDGDRKPYGARDADRKSYPRRDGDSKPYAKRDGERPYGKRDDDRKPYPKRDGESKPYAKRDGESKPYAKRDGDRRPYAKRDGDSKPYAKHDGDRPYGRRDDDRKPYAKREGDRPYAKRDGDRPYRRRDDDRKPYAKREGDRPYAKRDGAARDGAARDGKPPRPTRGGADRPDRATRPEELRPIRERHDDPVIPEEITPKDLHPSARNELKTLSKENAEWVARHLAMAAQLIDEDPELAHRHAISASRRAGRIAVVRETVAITAYATGDYALALRELRTYRRISGRDDQIALMVDSERGVGRADRALEVGRAVDRSALSLEVRVHLAIAMSGARLDLGEPERALAELDLPEVDPDRAFEWSPALFAARASVLEELGRQDEAHEWQRRAVVAADALDEASGAGDLEVVFVDEVFEESDDDASAETDGEDDEASGETDGEDDEDEDEGGAEDEDEDEGEAEDEGALQEPEHEDAAGGQHPSAPEPEPSIEDEVHELLVEAGVEDADEED